MSTPRFRILSLITAFAALLIVSAVPVFAEPTVLTPASERAARISVAGREEVRAELALYIDELEVAATSLFELPAAKAALAKSGHDPLADIRRARESVSLLTYQDLDVLRYYLASPAALEAPLAIQDIAERVAGKPGDGRFAGLAVDGTSCSPGPGTPFGIQDFFTAQYVAIGLEVLMECLPSDLITFEGHAVAAIAWGLACEAANVLENLNAVEAECLGAQEEVTQNTFRTTVTTFLGNETNYVSDNELDLGVTTITNNDNSNTQTIVNTDNTNTQTVLTKLDANTLIITTAIDASATAIINNDNSNRTQIINNDNSNRNTIITNDNSNRDTIINNDNSNRDLMVAEMRKIGCDVIRLLNTPEGQRQSSLSSCSGQPAFPYNFPEKSMNVTSAFTSTAIDLDAVEQPVRRPFASTVSLEIHLLEGRLLPTYYLPVARGGMIEDVKALVWSTLDAQRELGIAVGQLATAESFARAADDLLSQKSFVDAYRSYAKAYQQLLPE